MKIYFLDLNPRLSARFVMDKHVTRALIDAVQLLSTVMVRAGYWAPYHPQDGTWKEDPGKFRRLFEPKWPIKYKRGVPVSSIIERKLNRIRSLCPHSQRGIAGPITQDNAKTYSYRKSLYVHWLETGGNMDHASWVYEYAEELGSEYSRRWGIRKNDPDKIFHPAHLALLEMKNREYRQFWNGPHGIQTARRRDFKDYNCKNMTTWPLKIFSVGDFPENHYQNRLYAPILGQRPTVIWPDYGIDDGRSRSITNDMPKCSIFSGLREAMEVISKQIQDREIPSYRSILRSSFHSRQLPPYINPEEWSESFLHNAGGELTGVIAANRVRYLCLNGSERTLRNNSWSPPFKRREKIDNREDLWILGGPPVPLFRALLVIKKTCPWWFSDTYVESRRHFRIFRRLCARSRQCKCWCLKCNRGVHE